MGRPFPVLAPITSTVLFWIPFKEIFHLVRYPNWQSAITGTGRDSCCTISSHWAPYQNWAQCAWSHFRYGALPVPVQGSASSGTVIHWVPYRNWTLCAVGTPIGGFVGLWVCGFVGLWVCGFVVSVRTF